MQGTLVRWRGHTDVLSFARNPSLKVEFRSVLVPELGLLLTPEHRRISVRRVHDNDSFEEFGQVEVPASVIDAANALLQAETVLSDEADHLNELVSAIPTSHTRLEQQVITVQVVD